jgi:kinesin family protein 5
MCQGIYVAGVTEEYVTSDDELLSVMRRGAGNRQTAATGMNEGSSRSHSVFAVTIMQNNIETGSQKSSKLMLVDLAGSESVGKTGASGKQLEEAKTINKSLSALGQVINALTDAKIMHIPYRDSKLTRMLQESIGGNSRTTLVICMSPSSYNAVESVSTCRFGARAKAIENKAVINEQRSVEELEKLLKKAEFAIDMQQGHIAALEEQITRLTCALDGKPMPPPSSPVAAGGQVDEGGGVETVSSPEAAGLSTQTTEAIQKMQEKIMYLEVRCTRCTHSTHAH